MAKPQFEVIEDDQPSRVEAPAETDSSTALDILLLLLKPLSQKTVIALGNASSPTSVHLNSSTATNATVQTVTA